MTPVHNGGPTEDALFEFVAGRLHPQAGQWLGEHVAGCARCAATVERIQAVRSALEPPPEAPFRRQADLSAVRRRLERPAVGRRWLWAAAGVTAALALTVGLRARLAPPVDDTLAWSVVAREGVADVEAGGEHTVVQSHSRLPLGGKLSVQPGARVVATWGGARVVVEGGTTGAELRLVASRQAERTVALARGRVVLDVEPLGKRTLAVLTPDERVTVHGTQFLVDRGATTTVAVARGRVRVASAARSVDVDGGQRLFGGRTGALESEDLRTFARAAGQLAPPAQAESETLDIFADPPAAEVTVDGLAHGHAPLSLALAPGVHLVRVTAPGRLPLEEHVQVTAGAPTLFNAELARVVEPLAPPEPAHATPRPARPELAGLDARALRSEPVTDALAGVRADLLAGNDTRALARLELLHHRALAPTEAARAALLEAQAYRLERRPERALPLLEGAARGDGPEAEQAQLLYAQTLARDFNDPRRAAAAWSRSLARFPQGTFREEASYRLGESLLAAGETLDGLAAIDRYLEAFPKGAHTDDAHLAAAAAHRDRLNDCAGALPHLRAVAGGRGPRAEAALIGEARCLKVVGRVDEARAAYEAYLASAPHGRFAEEAQGAITRAERSR